jgi:hypothetical protein
MPRSLWTANCGVAPTIVMLVITGAAACAATDAQRAKENVKRNRTDVENLVFIILGIVR